MQRADNSGDGSGYGTGSGTGYGDGTGTGYGYGYGYGTGYGSGSYGTGFGFGSGSGDGDGKGTGYGTGTGIGYGNGDGDGAGYGYGDGYGTGKSDGYGYSYGDGNGNETKEGGFSMASNKAGSSRKTTRKTNNEMFAIITTQFRDLFYGSVKADDITNIAKKNYVIPVKACRHIAYWVGPKGGITSLAAEGPQKGSRIGLPVESCVISHVAHIFPVTTDAQYKFDGLATLK